MRGLAETRRLDLSLVVARMIIHTVAGQALCSTKERTPKRLFIGDQSGSLEARLCAQERWCCSLPRLKQIEYHRCMEKHPADRMNELLQPFTGHPQLHARVASVLQALPSEVRQDFYGDMRFRMSLETYVPEFGWTVLMHCPGPVGSDSRCVVLRAKLEHSSEAFAHYVIAHELAHAYLRNGGWGDIEDHEAAADALALHWGFARPRFSFL